MNTDKNETRKTLEVGCPGLCPVGLNYLTKTLNSTHFYSGMHKINKILLWFSLFILMAGLFISLGDL